VNDPIRHIGGPWFAVDTGQGVEKVRGRGAAQALVVDGEPEDLGFEHAETVTVTGVPVVPAERSETFAGPSIAVTLSATPDPATVTVTGPAGPVPVEVDGQQVRRDSAHFGRGRWTVTYRPA
jgi:hypothetical protein